MRPNSNRFPFEVDVSGLTGSVRKAADIALTSRLVRRSACAVWNLVEKVAEPTLRSDLRATLTLGPVLGRLEHLCPQHHISAFVREIVGAQELIALPLCVAPGGIGGEPFGYPGGLLVRMAVQAELASQFLRNVLSASGASVEGHVFDYAIAYSVYRLLSNAVALKWRDDGAIVCATGKPNTSDVIDFLELELRGLDTSTDYAILGDRCYWLAEDDTLMLRHLVRKEQALPRVKLPLLNKFESDLIGGAFQMSALSVEKYVSGAIAAFWRQNRQHYRGKARATDQWRIQRILAHYGERRIYNWIASREVKRSL